MASNKKDALAPQQVVTVGSARVSVVKKLAEGGFAAVYLVADAAGRQYALKKLIVHNESANLRRARSEIELMLKFTGCKYIVSLLASEERKTQTRFTEFLMLMEFCPGGHIVDIMNRRLTRPFSEDEVLKIIGDTAVALYALHHSSPPVIHRDIKPENVLLSQSKSIFKLCDFGSATTVSITPGVEIPIALVEEDIDKFTTMQFRAPEMVDLYLGHRISEKADIWALGCMLFKIMFFADAFEASKLSILSAKVKIPKVHKFSTDLVMLLNDCLKSDPSERIDVDEVLRRVYRLRRLECPVDVSPKLLFPPPNAVYPIAATAKAAKLSASQPPSHPASRKDSFAELRRPSENPATPPPVPASRAPSSGSASSSAFNAFANFPTNGSESDWAAFPSDSTQSASTSATTTEPESFSFTPGVTPAPFFPEFAPSNSTSISTSTTAPAMTNHRSSQPTQAEPPQPLALSPASARRARPHIMPSANTTTATAINPALNFGHSFSQPLPPPVKYEMKPVRKPSLNPFDEVAEGDDNDIHEAHADLFSSQHGLFQPPQQQQLQQPEQNLFDHYQPHHELFASFGSSQGDDLFGSQTDLFGSSLSLEASDQIEDGPWGSLKEQKNEQLWGSLGDLKEDTLQGSLEDLSEIDNKKEAEIEKEIEMPTIKKKPFIKTRGPPPIPPRSPAIPPRSPPIPPRSPPIPPRSPAITSSSPSIAVSSTPPSSAHMSLSKHELKVRLAAAEGFLSQLEAQSDGPSNTSDQNLEDEYL